MQPLLDIKLNKVMGFNYLQTDDRDDYFDSFKSGRKKEPVGYMEYTVSKEGVLIFTGNAWDTKMYMKKLLNLTARYVKFGRWKDECINRGYTIEENLIKY